MGRHRKRKEAHKHLKKRRKQRSASRQNAPRGPRQGRVQKNPRGFAFLLTGVPGADLYVPAEEAYWLLNDDIVEFKVQSERGRKFAVVERVVRRGQSEVVGRLYAEGDQLFLVSLDGEAHSVPKAPTGGKINHWVVGRFSKYPSRQHRGQITVTEILGPELLPKHDILLASARFGLPRQFSSEALEAAFLGKLSARAALVELGERRDLRDVPLVTIDGADAKDFDDAVAVVRNSGGSPFVLYVSIADVSHFVTPGSPLDAEAKLRGTSVYFPGVCLPMLPEGLSNELCSLMPRVDRLAFTAEIHLDRNGKAVKSFFYKSVIKTAARLTYEQVQTYFDVPAKADPVFQTLSEPMKSLRALYRLMARLRAERGALDFELPESSIDVDAEGWPLACGRRERLESHRLIEEFMIAANSEVARALRKRPSLFRVHEPPASGAVEDVNQMMRSLGISRRMTEATPKAFAEVLAATKDLKGAATLHQAILRLQKQARYEAAPKGHFGLALADYTHFTSPIRRYPDLVVHRSLTALIGNPKDSDKEDEESSLAPLGERLSELERRAAEAERYVKKRKQCWFLKERLGATFKGTIAGVTARGIFVEIEPHAIEGFCPVESLGGFFEFDEKRQCLRARPGHRTLSLGDSFSVLVEQVSLEENQITFAPGR